MKFTAVEDIAAPIDTVFKAASNFEGFERSALRRGVKVQRINDLNKKGALISWDIEVSFRNKMRRVYSNLTQHDAPNSMLVTSQSGGIIGDLNIDLVALSRNRTRMSVTVDIKPTTLSSRLLVQSLRMAKSNLNRGFQKRVARFAEDVEDSHGAA